MKKTGLFAAGQKKPLVTNVRVADTSSTRARGLMFKAENNFDYALVFEWKKLGRATRSLHMLFVFFEIGVLFLDEKKRVVEKAVLKPWRLNYTPRHACQTIIVLPKELISKVKIGDKLQW